MKKILTTASCVLSCFSLNGEDLHSTINSVNSNYPVVCQEDLLIFSDGTQKCGKLESLPLLKYSFGNINFEKSEINAIAFLGHEGHTKAHFMTTNGRSFVAETDDAPILFTEKDGSSLRISPDHVRLIVIGRNDTHKLYSSNSKTHTIKLKNGDFLTAVISEEPIPLNNGIDTIKELNPKEILAIYSNGGLHGEISKGMEKEHLDLSFTIDKHLLIHIPQKGISLKLPWDQIECIECESYSSAPKEKDYLHLVENLKKETKSEQDKYNSYRSVLKDYLNTLDILSTIKQEEEQKEEVLLFEDRIMLEQSMAIQSKGPDAPAAQPLKITPINQLAMESKGPSLPDQDSVEALADDSMTIDAKDMVYVPPGRYLLSITDSESNKHLLPLQTPSYIVEVHGFYIDKNNVTNAQYLEYVNETKAEKPKHWLGGTIPKGQENQPVVNVSYQDALGYAHWMGKRLPTESEWEAAHKQAKLNVLKLENNGKYAEWTSTIEKQKTQAPLASLKNPISLKSPAQHRVIRHNVAANPLNNHMGKTSAPENSCSELTSFRCVIDYIQ